MKKIFAIIMSVLMLACFMPSMAFADLPATAEAKTIYVDDDSTATSPDGTAEKPYKTIQSAVNAASNGDTVLVRTGNYNVWCPTTSADNYTGRNHNLFIGKNITIKGEDNVNIYSLPSSLQSTFDGRITVLISGSEGVVLDNLNIYPCYYSTEVSGLPTVTESEINRITETDTLCVYYNQIIDTLTNYNNGKSTSESTIENVTIKNCTIGDENLDADEWGSAIYLNGYVNNSQAGISGGYLIEGNTLYGSVCVCEDGGWKATELGQNCIIRNNTLYDTIILNGNRPTGWNYKSVTVKPTITGNTFNSANWTLEDDRVEYNYCVGARDASDDKVFTPAELEKIIEENTFAGDLEEKNIGVAIGRHSYKEADDEAYSVIYAFSPVASITSDGISAKYSTLAEAVNAATDGQTIELLDDVTVADSTKGDTQGIITINKNIVIDGSGHTITFAQTTGDSQNASGINIESGAKVTLKNLILDANKTAKHGINIFGGDVTLDSVTVKNFTGYGVVVQGEAAATNLATIDCGWGGVNVDVRSCENDSDFTLDSGTVQSVAVEHSKEEKAYKVKATINGGTIGAAYIYDGTKVVESLDSTELIIKGGTFSIDPSKYVESGYLVNTNADKTYTVYKYVAPYVTTTPSTDEVTNKTEDKTTGTATSTTATVKNTTKTSADGTKTVSATVSTETAEKM